MLAYFGTDVDWGEGTVRVDLDGMEGVSIEWSDKIRCLNLLKVDLPSNGVKKVSVDEFLPQVPDVVALFIDD